MKKAPFIRRTSRDDMAGTTDASSTDPPPGGHRRKVSGKKWAGAKLMSSITFGSMNRGRPSMSSSVDLSCSDSYNLQGLELDDTANTSSENHVRFNLPPQDNENGGIRERVVRKSTVRRQNVNASELTMGLSDLSANFLDLMLKSKGIDWLKSLSLRDPRFCIKMFFDDVAKDGADAIEDPDGRGFHPELLSPLLAMFQRSR